MKKLLFLLTLICGLSLHATAQFKAGIRAGLSSTDIQPNQLIINNSNTLNDFGLTVKDANYGLHFGLFAQAQIGKFFLQPEMIFNSNSVDFTRNDVGEGNIADKVFREKYQYLDFPLMMGFKFGPLRLQAGPVGHLFLNSTSELFEIEGYSQKFDEFTYGYQTGLGLDIGKIMLDFKYEGSFNNFGDHIVFGNQQYEFDKRPGKFIASLGIAF